MVGSVSKIMCVLCNELFLVNVFCTVNGVRCPSL